MRFSADRKQMANICKNLARIVPNSSPVADLTGILFEADEDSGSLRLAGTNMEISLECTCGAVVAEGGRMVVNANLIAGMMPLLKEDTVSFAVSPAGNTVRIESGSTVYDISCLPGKHFPEPGAAPPDNMVKISGLAGLVRQTAFAAKKKAGAPGDVLMNAKLDVYPSETHMTCTDGSMLAIARRQITSSGRISLLIPEKTLSLLTAVCGNGDVEAVICGSMLVFKGTGFVFTTRTMQGIYPDTNALLSQIKPIYDAIADARTFYSGVNCAGTFFEPGMYARLALRESGIEMSYESSLGTFNTTIDAAVLNDMPGEGFYYSAGDLGDALKNMDGNLQIMIDRTGNMLLKGENLCYFLTPYRKSRSVEKAKPEKKQKTKKAAKAKKEPQAA